MAQDIRPHCSERLCRLRYPWSAWACTHAHIAQWDLLSGVRRLQATILVALLQPDPEVWSLFDDVIFMSEGIVVRTLPGC